MTRSLSLAGLPFLGAISTPLHYKQKVQKMKDFPKTWVLPEKQFEDFRRKKQKNRNNNLDLSEKTQWKTKNLTSINRSWPSKTVRVKLEKNLKRKRIKIKTVGTSQN